MTIDPYVVFIQGEVNKEKILRKKAEYRLRCDIVFSKDELNQIDNQDISFCFDISVSKFPNFFSVDAEYNEQTVYSLQVDLQNADIESFLIDFIGGLNDGWCDLADSQEFLKGKPRVRYFEKADIAITKNLRYKALLAIAHVGELYALEDGADLINRFLEELVARGDKIDEIIFDYNVLSSTLDSVDMSILCFE